jgi:hypothetical protein
MNIDEHVYEALKLSGTKPRFSGVVTGSKEAGTDRVPLVLQASRPGLNNFDCRGA